MEKHYEEKTTEYISLDDTANNVQSIESLSDESSKTLKKNPDGIIQERSNVFSFMMSNTHFQDKDVEDSKYIEQTNELKEPKKKQRKEKICKSKIHKENAFSFLMSNRDAFDSRDPDVDEPPKKRKVVSFSEFVSKIQIPARKVKRKEKEQLCTVTTLTDLSDSKSLLINQTEDIDMIEMFKDEIFECMQSKKRCRQVAMPIPEFDTRSDDEDISDPPKIEICKLSGGLDVKEIKDTQLQISKFFTTNPKVSLKRMEFEIKAEVYPSPKKQRPTSILRKVRSKTRSTDTAYLFKEKKENSAGDQSMSNIVHISSSMISPQKQSPEYLTNKTSLVTTTVPKALNFVKSASIFLSKESTRSVQLEQMSVSEICTENTEDTNNKDITTFEVFKLNKSINGNTHNKLKGKQDGKILANNILSDTSAPSSGSTTQLRRSSRIPTKREPTFLVDDSDEEVQPTKKRTYKADKENINQDNILSTKPPRIRRLKSRKMPIEEELVQTTDASSCESDIEEIPSQKLKGPSKMASIFNKNKSEIVLSPAKVKARQDFLFSDSDVEHLARTPSQSSEEELPWPPIPVFAHVMQATNDTIWNLPEPDLQLLEECGDSILSTEEQGTLGLFCPPPETIKLDLKPMPLLNTNAMSHILLHIKKKDNWLWTMQAYKSYDDGKKAAVQTYNKELQKENDDIMILSPEKENTGQEGSRKRKGKSKKKSKRRKTDNIDITEELANVQNWDPIAWTQSFAPKLSDHFIGSQDTVIAVKKWLEEWKQKTENDALKEQNQRLSRYSENSSSGDGECELVNTILLSGPTGGGKSALVHALAQELGFKVLEINASSRRTGKLVMNHLSEATQSHSVSGTDNRNGSQELQAKSKWSIAKENIAKADLDPKKNMALIVFDDIDVIFDEYDDGFMCAVNNFMATTKRPIILTCSQSSVCTQSKIKGNFYEYSVGLTVERPARVAQHLQLMCLANGIFASASEIECLVKVNRGDIRKCVQDLQFWSLSGATKIQWLTMDNLTKSKNKMSEQDIADENMMKAMFGKSPMKKWSETAISSGCLWAHANAQQARDSRQQSSSTCGSMTWDLIDPNAEHLFCFPLQVQPKATPVYPLHKDHPLVKEQLLFRRDRLWDDEDDRQFLTDACMSDKQQQQPIPTTYPKNVQRATTTCIDALAKMYNTLSHLDILDCSKSHAQLSSRARYATCLNDTFPVCESRSWAQRNMVDELLSQISTSCYKQTKKAIEQSLHTTDDPSKYDCLQLCVPKHAVNMMFEPHQLKSMSWRDERLCACEKFSQQLPLPSRMNSRVQSMDYLPFIRQFIRCDELARVIARQNRRNGRYLSQVTQMGFYNHTASDLTIAANIFTSPT